MAYETLEERRKNGQNLMMNRKDYLTRREVENIYLYLYPYITSQSVFGIARTSLRKGIEKMKFDDAYKMISSLNSHKSSMKLINNSDPKLLLYNAITPTENNSHKPIEQNNLKAVEVLLEDRDKRFLINLAKKKNVTLNALLTMIIRAKIEDYYKRVEEYIMSESFKDFELN